MLPRGCSGYLCVTTRQSWQPSPRTLIWLATAYGDGFWPARLLPVLAGYYLLKDKDAVTGNDAATLFIVKVVGNRVTIEP